MSDQPKYTPGPWRTGPQTQGTGAKNYCEAGTSVYAGPIREHDIGKRIALCHFEGSTEQERLANARLIAAAPDLLAACQAIADLIGDSLYAEDFPQRANTILKHHLWTAIANARGEAK